MDAHSKEADLVEANVRIAMRVPGYGHRPALLVVACLLAGCGGNDALHDALDAASETASNDSVHRPADGYSEGFADVPGESATDGEAFFLDSDETLIPDRVGEAGPMETVGTEALFCDCVPPTLSITVNDIPYDMNGSVPYLDDSGMLQPFHLALPTQGFVVNLEVECECGCDPVASAFSFDMPAGGLAAGTNLWPLFEEAGNGKRFLRMTPGLSLPVAPAVLLVGHAVDICGQESTAAALTVETVEMTPLLHPFDIEDPWLLTYHRDHYTVTLVEDGPEATHVEAEAASNGIDDFLEDLWTVGLGCESPTAEFAAVECEGGTGGNECLARELLRRTREKAYKPFLCGPDGSKGEDSVSIRFYIEGEPEAPESDTFEYQFLDQVEGGVPPGGKAFSILGFGGGDLSKSWVGMSETMDLHNVRNENNGKFGYGCFTTSLVRFFYEYLGKDPNLYALAKTALADLLPVMGGVAVGELPGDELLIDFSVADEDLPKELVMRRKTLDTLLDVLATGLGALAAHEIGHSLGLVPKGAPPLGLFAGETQASFITNPDGSKGPHIDTAGPNLMQAGPGSGNNKLDISMLLTPFFFNELNLAYLQGHLVVK